MIVPPGASAVGEGRRKLDQRPGEDVGDEQVERRAGGEQRRVHAVGDREQQLARAVAELHAVDRGIVAGDVDGDRVDVGGDALAPPATAPAPRRRAGRCRCRCRRYLRIAQPLRSSRSSASRQPAVVACWPVPKARPASISKLMAPSGPGRDGSACGRRSGRRGSARARPGSSSPNRPRPAPRARAAPRAEAGEHGEVVSGRADARNKRGSASRRAAPGRARRRPAPAGWRGRRRGRRRSGDRLAPARGVQGMVTRQLILRLGRRFLGQPLVERRGRARPHRSLHARRGSSSAPRRVRSGRRSLLDDGCGRDQQMSHVGCAAILAIAGCCGRRRHSRGWSLNR